MDLKLVQVVEEKKENNGDLEVKVAILEAKLDTLQDIVCGLSSGVIGMNQYASFGPIHIEKEEEPSIIQRDTVLAQGG